MISRSSMIAQNMDTKQETTEYSMMRRCFMYAINRTARAARKIRRRRKRRSVAKFPRTYFASSMGSCSMAMLAKQISSKAFQYFDGPQQNCPCSAMIRIIISTVKSEKNALAMILRVGYVSKPASEGLSFSKWRSVSLISKCVRYPRNIVFNMMAPVMKPLKILDMVIGSRHFWILLLCLDSVGDVACLVTKSSSELSSEESSVRAPDFFLSNPHNSGRGAACGADGAFSCEGVGGGNCLWGTFVRKRCIASWWSMKSRCTDCC
mmetsp:Transcript_108514/g.215483  ORF Transcript_108514/g.215483 Transcript_108514/m.215483 type:complete len:264 (+) Transcript_108514:49-840(+)